MGRRWLPPTQPTAFQQLMIDYMRLHWPMDLAALAVQLQIAPTTVHGWFYAGRIPHASTLRQVALTTGIPLAVLYQAAGYDVPEPGAYVPPVPAVVWDSFERWAEEAFPGMDAIPRGALVAEIRSMRRGETEQYAARIAAEHRIVEAEPAPQTASGERDNATDRQHEQPAQATRSRRRSRREMARTS